MDSIAFHQHDLLNSLTKTMQKMAKPVNLEKLANLINDSSHDMLTLTGAHPHGGRYPRVGTRPETRTIITMRNSNLFNASPVIPITTS